MVERSPGQHDQQQHRGAGQRQGQLGQAGPQVPGQGPQAAQAFGYLLSGPRETSGDRAWLFLHVLRTSLLWRPSVL
ncbi:hypothetical protein [Fodinicurvata halophila]|uniref:hypothetical protein n=1 Tax=Fodinicurvata halophila TaxID=1419723 RepID=UPI0036287B6D